MTDDAPTSTRPFANMLSAASAGNIKLKMDLDQFVYLDRDCDTFLAAIKTIQEIAQDTSRISVWGLGESTVSDSGKKLTSGETLVNRFKAKSQGSNDKTDNSVHAIMEAHKQAVEDLQNLYRTIRKQITDHDSEQAAKYASLEKSLPNQAAVSVTPFTVLCYAG
jgi:hypothetical protein